jgi:hypothetical protein
MFSNSIPDPGIKFKMKPLISLGLSAIVTLSLSCALLSIATAAQSNRIIVKKAPVVGAIKKKIEFGPQCHFTFAKPSKNQGKSVLSYIEDEKPIALMNIDNKDVQLSQTLEKRGEGNHRSFEKYVYGDVTVTLTFSPTEDGKEGTYYGLKIIAQRGGKNTVTQAEGYCGA